MAEARDILGPESPMEGSVAMTMQEKIHALAMAVLRADPGDGPPPAAGDPGSAAGTPGQEEP